MKKIKYVVICIIVLVVYTGAASLSAQIKYGGYLSLEFLKSQEEGDFQKGRIERLMAGLFASGVFSEKFGFALEMRSDGTTDFNIKQAWAGFLPSEKFGLKAGLFLVPFGTWNAADRPHQQLLIGTPLNLLYLYPESWREIGLLVDGKISIFSYAFYTGNGLKEAGSLNSGQQFKDNNSKLASGGRLALDLSQAISLGASLYNGAFDNEGLRNIKLEGLDVSVVTSQWEVHSEITKGSIENPEPFEKGQVEGYSIWAVMSFRTLQPVVSYQKIKYDDPFHGGGIIIGQKRWTLGFRWVISSGFFLKLEYDWNKEEPALKNNTLRIQAALGF